MTEQERIIAEHLAADGPSFAAAVLFTEEPTDRALTGFASRRSETIARNVNAAALADALYGRGAA